MCWNGRLPVWAEPVLRAAVGEEAVVVRGALTRSMLFCYAVEGLREILRDGLENLSRKLWSVAEDIGGQ